MRGGGGDMFHPWVPKYIGSDIDNCAQDDCSITRLCSLLCVDGRLLSLSGRLLLMVSSDFFFFFW